MNNNNGASDSDMMFFDGEDRDGGISNEEREAMQMDNNQHAEEPIYFDQTTRHIGSIQKNMVLSQGDS